MVGNLDSNMIARQPGLVELWDPVVWYDGSLRLSRTRRLGHLVGIVRRLQAAFWDNFLVVDNVEWKRLGAIISEAAAFICIQSSRQRRWSSDQMSWGKS